MKRRAFNVLAAVSLVSCVAATAMWVRSFWSYDARLFQFRGVRWELASDRGRLSLSNGPQRAIEAARATQAYQRAMIAEDRQYRQAYVRSKASQPAKQDDFPPGTLEWVWKKAMVVDAGRQEFKAFAAASAKRMDAALAAYNNAVATMTPTVGASVSFAWLAIPTAVAPVIWLRRRWSEREPRAGHCHACGYDLRATPDRCPECGAVAARSITGIAA